MSSRRRVLLLLLGLGVAGSLSAQTVGPAVMQYPGSAEGSFEIRNDGITPLVVTLEAKSFTIDAAGAARYQGYSCHPVPP